MIADFTAGVGYLFKGFRMIRQPGLRRYFIGPITVNILVFVSLIWFGGASIAAAMQKILPSGETWWSGIIGIIMWLLLGVIILVFAFFLFTMLVNFIGSPFNGLLAEKIERSLVPPELESKPRKSHFFTDIISSFTGEVKKYTVFLVIWLFLIAATVTPIVNLVTGPIAAILAPIFGAWMMALEYVSYPMNNHNKYFTDVRKWLRTNRMLSLGFGFAVMVATLVPVLNLFVMPAAVAGATALWVERRDIDSVKLY